VAANLLPSDREFAHFLAWVDPVRVADEQLVAGFDTKKVRRYDAETEQMLKTIRRKPVRALPSSYQNVIDRLTATQAAALNELQRAVS
jgi:hypothetical protein